MNGTNGSVGTIIGEALRPRDVTVLDKLYEARNEAMADVRLARADLHDIDEEIARTQGDADGAEYHRLAAVDCRHPSPANAAAADRAWLVSMARWYMQRGARPDMGAPRQAEIDAVCDELAGSHNCPGTLP